MDIVFINFKGFGGNNVMVIVFLLIIILKMLVKCYGDVVMV